MERLFSTGGFGFIGINVMERFLKADIQVRNYNCYSMADCVEVCLGQLGSNYHFIQGDMLDGERLWLPLGESGANAVIHMAVVTATEDKGKNDTRHIFDMNCKGTLNILDVSVAVGIRCLLYVSLIAVYGTTAYKVDILTEEMENLSPENLRQVSRFTSKKLALRYQYFHHMDVTYAGLGGASGPWGRPTRFRGKMSAPCITLKYAMDGTQAVLKKPDRTSWVYSRDIASALFWLAGRSPEWDVYNLSFGSTQSIADWYQTLCSCHSRSKWRLAGREEESNMFYHGIRNNVLMSVSRLRKSGHTSRYDMEKAMKNCIARAEEYPQMFGRVK